MDIYTGETNHFMPGDLVYVMYRNPHTPSVANVQQAAVVHHPERSGELALFIHDTYYPLTDELAVYRSEDEAEQAYQYYFGEM
ncbi:MAG TPA: transcriptional regulator SplA domain-containing protein [Chondromyces sp.]|nr:transcriptional regulator SplA domain-containing protein [Chondromyces sp.]